VNKGETDMLPVHITFGITIGLLTVLAIVLSMGKATILINGMMFLPKEARDKVNKKNLGRFVSIMLMVINILMALMWMDIAWLETYYLWLTWTTTGLMFAAIIPFVIVGVKMREKWFGLQK